MNKEQFSIRRAILAQMNGRAQREIEARVISETSSKHYPLTGGTSNDAVIVPVSTRSYTAGSHPILAEEQQELLLPLDAELVLAKAGATILTGLKGNVQWPKHTGLNVSWEGENVEAKDAGGAFEKGSLFKPKRLTAYIDISKQLLVQENRSIEAMLRNMISTVIIQKVEETAFSAAEAVENVPKGMFQNAASLGELSWANIVKMETDAGLQNAQLNNLAYVVHPTLSGLAKTKVKDATGAGGFIADGYFLNGYKTFRTNNIPTGLGVGIDEYGIAFGNWADYFLGQWGGVELIANKYSLATNGMVRIVVNSYWDMGFIRSNSFTIGSMK